MSGISKYTYTTLKQAIQDYTEVSSDVLTTTILDGIIMAAEMRINQELPMDSDRFVQEGTLVANDNTINAPAGTLFIRGIEVFNSTANTEGNGTWLEKKDQTYLSEFVDRKFGPQGEIQAPTDTTNSVRSEEHTSELQSRLHLVCRLLLEKKKKKQKNKNTQNKKKKTKKNKKNNKGGFRIHSPLALE